MTQLPTITRSIWGRLLERGLFTEPQLTELLAAPEHHLAEPGTVVVRSPLFQAWGRKPSRGA